MNLVRGPISFWMQTIDLDLSIGSCYYFSLAFLYSLVAFASSSVGSGYDLLL